MPPATWQVLVVVAAIGFVGQAGRATGADSAPTFERDVRPILKAHCFHCHGEGEKLSGLLDLRLRRLAAEGGRSGPALIPGDPDDSLLLARIKRGEMPPGEDSLRLSPREIETLQRWIGAGAPTLRAEPDDVDGGLLITEEEREFWAWQPVRRPAVPAVKDASRVRTPIDAFLLARLEAEGAGFAPDADRATLVRRASFDLLGLPPAPEEVQQFVDDDEPKAYARLLDRLLASSHYGERWGRHWLDVAGYADSEGYTSEDPVREHAWKYRDYVIRAFNDDMPFDRFLREQLAGDEMLTPPFDNLSPDEADKLIATGFLRMAPDGTGGAVDDAALARNEVIAGTVNIVSTAILGLTVGCAQCHHHRYDPIPQQDYYRLRAVFEPALDWKNWRAPRQRLVSLYTDADRQAAARIEAEAKEIERLRAAQQQEFIDATFERELEKLADDLHEPIRAARGTPAKDRTPEQRQLLKEHPSVNVTAGSLYLYDRKAADELKQLADKAAEVRATKPKEEFVRAMTEPPGHLPQTYLFHRGDHDQPKEAVTPAELTILALAGQAADLPVDDPALPTTGRRLAWASRLTDGTHPLVARVIVNRVWMHHFGRGIVATPGDFGALGERPSHPELLDWLAAEFMESGWSLKRLHRLIMASTAWRQGSSAEFGMRNADADVPHSALGTPHSSDPDNRCLSRFDVRRLDAEAFRDSVLAVSGTLNRKAFGPPVPVMADVVGQFVLGIENLNAGRPGAVIPLHGEEFRRSVYVQVRRSRPLAVLDTFDWPAMEPNCEVRASSTVTPQSLLLMNSDFIVEQSEKFAERVRREAGEDRRAQAGRAWRLALSREPTEEELDEAVAFLEEQAGQFGKTAKAGSKEQGPSPPQQALAAFCQVLFSSNAFLYVD